MTWLVNYHLFARNLTAAIRERGGDTLCVVHPRTGELMLLEPEEHTALMAKIEAEELALERASKERALVWRLHLHGFFLWFSLIGMLTHVWLFIVGTAWWALPAAIGYAWLAECEYDRRYLTTLQLQNIRGQDPSCARDITQRK